MLLHVYILRKWSTLIPGVDSSWLVSVRPGVPLLRVLFRPWISVLLKGETVLRFPNPVAAR